MNKLKYVMRYIVAKHRREDELKETYIREITFLCDWLHSLYTGKQSTNIEWCKVIGATILVMDYFEIENETINDSFVTNYNSYSKFGVPIEVLEIKENKVNKDMKIKLTQSEIQIIDFVLYYFHELSYLNFRNKIVDVLRDQKEGYINMPEKDQDLFYQEVAKMRGEIAKKYT